jgi:uncharacterized protein YaaQ
MKMILAVMPTGLSDQISQTLIRSEFRVTKFASTASLFSGGTTTLMVVENAARVENALELIRANIPPEEDAKDAPPRVTIYVLKVKDFERVQND